MSDEPWKFFTYTVCRTLAVEVICSQMKFHMLVTYLIIEEGWW